MRRWISPAPIARPDSSSSRSRSWEKAAQDWLGADGYTHIFIRHSEIDSTTDAFFELMSDVRSGDAQSASGAYEKLAAHLDSLYTMERVTLGSIF